MTTPTGVQHKKRMTWELTDSHDVALQRLVTAQARRHVLTQIIELIHGLDGWQQSTGQEIVALLDFERDQALEIPIAVVTENAKYLKTKATADGDTIKGQWPGLRFFDGGSTAVAPWRGGGKG